MRTNDKSYQAGDRIFAKMKGYPFWPARVDGLFESSKDRYRIFFYGTHESAVMSGKDLYNYEKNKSKYALEKKLKGFNEGLVEIEDDPHIQMNDKHDTETEDNNHDQSQAEQSEPGSDSQTNESNDTKQEPKKELPKKEPPKKKARSASVKKKARSASCRTTRPTATTTPTTNSRPSRRRASCIDASPAVDVTPPPTPTPPPSPPSPPPPPHKTPQSKRAPSKRASSRPKSVNKRHKSAAADRRKSRRNSNATTVPPPPPRPDSPDLSEIQKADTKDYTAAAISVTSVDLGKQISHYEDISDDDDEPIINISSDNTSVEVNVPEVNVPEVNVREVDVPEVIVPEVNVAEVIEDDAVSSSQHSSQTIGVDGTSDTDTTEIAVDKSVDEEKEEEEDEEEVFIPSEAAISSTLTPSTTTTTNTSSTITPSTNTPSTTTTTTTPSTTTTTTTTPSTTTTTTNPPSTTTTTTNPTSTMDHSEDIRSKTLSPEQSDSKVDHQRDDDDDVEESSSISVQCTTVNEQHQPITNKLLTSHKATKVELKKKTKRVAAVTVKLNSIELKRKMIEERKQAKFLQKKNKRISEQESLKESILMNINKEIKMSLKSSCPDHTRCIEIMNKLKQLNITREMWVKYPDIVHTLKSCKRYMNNDAVRRISTEIYANLKKEIHSSEEKVSLDITIVLPDSPHTPTNSILGEIGEKTPCSDIFDADDATKEGVTKNQPFELPTTVNSKPLGVGEEEIKLDKSISEDKLIKYDTNVDENEKIEKTKKSEEIEKTKKTEEIEKTEEIDKTKKIEDIDKTKKTDEIDKTKKTEELDKTKKTDDIEITKKIDEIVEKTKIIDEIEKTKEIDEIEKTNKIDKIEKTKKADEIEKTNKTDEIEITSEIEKTDEIEKISKTNIKESLIEKPVSKTEIIKVVEGKENLKKRSVERRTSKGGGSDEKSSASGYNSDEEYNERRNRAIEELLNDVNQATSLNSMTGSVPVVTTATKAECNSPDEMEFRIDKRIRIAQLSSSEPPKKRSKRKNRVLPGDKNSVMNDEELHNLLGI